MIPAPVHIASLPAATVAFWTRVAQCETGGNWKMQGPSYEGGLGFYFQTWRWWATELGLIRLYPHAWQAPRMVQIEVAQYGRSTHDGYWGCLDK